jgi:hypothetical protein
LAKLFHDAWNESRMKQIIAKKLQFSVRNCEESWDPADSPDRIQERRCIVALLESVTQKIAETHGRAGNQGRFKVLSPLMLSPEEALNRSELAEK